jgi:hypothetical protein
MKLIALFHYSLYEKQVATFDQCQKGQPFYIKKIKFG